MVVGVISREGCSSHTHTVERSSFSFSFAVIPAVILAVTSSSSSSKLLFNDILSPQA